MSSAIDTKVMIDFHLGYGTNETKRKTEEQETRRKTGGRNVVSD